MQCPLYAAKLLDSKDFVEVTDVECDKEDCSWWLPFEQRCALLGIAFELALIRQVLFNIEAKLPTLQTPEATDDNAT